MSAGGGERARWSFWRRRRLTLGLAALGAIAAIAVAVLDGPGPAAGPDAFYEQPDPLPDGAAGTLIRSAAVADPPAGAMAVRILYRSRSYTGRPVALSALIVVPLKPAPASGRNIVALTHGTVGVSPPCAVSRGSASFAQLDGLARFMRAGYAVVAPDYEGLGTRGPHPYLVGDATARATLDAVRATAQFGPAKASRRFAVFGASQGGHAALFTGQQAATYAPELELAGVAAAAPVADLRRLLKRNRATTLGSVAAAYMLATWSRVYPQLRLDDVLTDAGRGPVQRLSAQCLPADHGALKTALGDAPVRLDYVRRNPWDREPWKGLLARNSPGADPIPAPVIVTQGAADPFVRASLTARLVRRLCSQGTTVQYRPSRAIAHIDVGPKTAPYISKWIARRFAGEAARTTC